MRARVDAFLGIGLSVLALAVACSSSSGGSSGSSSGGSSSSSSSGSSTFTCTINGTTYDCPNQAAMDKCSNFANPDPSGCTQRGSGGSTSSSSSSTSTSSSSGGTCNLFTCKATADCGGVAPCMSTSTGTNYCYEQEGSPAQCSQGTTATSAMVDGSSRTLCVPSGCPQPSTYLP